MLILITIMYLWAAATIYIVYMTVSDRFNMSDVLAALFWPAVIPLLILVVIMELFDILWRKFR